MARDHWWIPAAIALSLLCWQPAFAQSANKFGEMRMAKLRQIETEVSMELTGTLSVAADGRVESHAIDDRSLVPAAVLAYLDDQIAHWQVDGVDGGEAAAVSVPFSARLVARPDGEHYRLRVASTMMGDPPGGDAASILRARGRSLEPPLYPKAALRAGAAGTVYALLKVARDGSVEDVFVEQVNLEVLAADHVLARLRRELSGAVVAAAESWRFEVPTVGPAADQPYHVVRLPTQFVLVGQEAGYGEWTRYVPGERHYAPWAAYSADEGGIDAGRTSVARLVGTGPRLIRNASPPG